MPRITHLETIPYDVPLTSTLSWGKGHSLAQLNHVLVRVTLSDGATGLAEATPRPTIYGETQTSVQAIVAQHLAPLLLGQSLNTRADVDTLAERLAIIKNNHTAKGALNMALHGALAQSQGVSLATYLGVTRQSVQVSYIVGTGDADTVLADVSAAYDAGVRVFKVKIGKALTQEIAIIERLQQAYTDCQLYVDANQCLLPENALRVLDELHDRALLWCEEPLPIQQLPERMALHQQTHMPLIADDSAFTFAALQRELAMDTFDILNIKTPRTGFSQSRRMLQAASAAQKQIMIGSQASSLLGCMHAALFAAHEQVNCASECTFFLKTLHAQQDVLLNDGMLSIDEVQRQLKRWHHDAHYA